MEKKNKVDIILPVYREEENIEEVISGIENIVKIPHKLLAVWQDPHDPTLPILKKLQTRYKNLELLESKTGIGVIRALKTGYGLATAPLIVTMMADLSDDPLGIEKMVRKIEEGYDVVCASRYHPLGRKLGGPFLKGLLSRVSCYILFTFFRFPTSDATNAYKCFKRSFLQSVVIESKGGFELPLELVVKSYQRGLKIVDIPTVWQERKSGKSKFKLVQWLPGYARWFFLAAQSSISRQV